MTKNGSQNRSRGSSGLDFVDFLILMPLSYGIGVYGVPGRQKSMQNRSKIQKKNNSTKNTLHCCIFCSKNRFFVKKCSLNGPRTDNHEPWFSLLFRPWTPKGAQGAPKGAQSEPQGAPGTQKLSKKVPKSKKIGAKVCRKYTKSHHIFFVFWCCFSTPMLLLGLRSSCQARWRLLAAGTGFTIILKPVMQKRQYLQ